MIIFTCGSTGGHVYPAIAVAQTYRPDEVHFIGSKKRQDQRIIPKYGFSLSRITASHRNPFKIVMGFLKSLWILWRKDAELVVATGGYLTVPVLLAAFVKGCPVIMLEQNALPGRVNRKFQGLADKICLSFEESQSYFNKEKAIVTGNPLRLSYPKDEMAERILSHVTSPMVLAFGGSQAAQALSDMLVLHVDRLLDEDYCWVILVGDTYFDQLLETFLAEDGLVILRLHECAKIIFAPAVEAMGDLYAKASVVLCRAGASSVSELLHYKTPAILVPYPYAKDNHQHHNAEAFVKQFPGKIIKQDELSYAGIINGVRELISHKGKEPIPTTSTAAMQVRQVCGEVLKS